MHGGKSRDFRAESAGSQTSGASESAGHGADAELTEDVPVLESSALFGGGKQVVIGHNGCRYVLRITRFGKLVLNK